MKENKLGEILRTSKAIFILIFIYKVFISFYVFIYDKISRVFKKLFLYFRINRIMDKVRAFYLCSVTGKIYRGFLNSFDYSVIQRSATVKFFSKYSKNIKTKISYSKNKVLKKLTRLESDFLSTPIRNYCVFLTGFVVTSLFFLFNLKHSPGSKSFPLVANVLILLFSFLGLFSNVNLKVALTSSLFYKLFMKSKLFHQEVQ